jgi:hypothetical protein
MAAAVSRAYVGAQALRHAGNESWRFKHRAKVPPRLAPVDNRSLRAALRQTLGGRSAPRGAGALPFATWASLLQRQRGSNWMPIRDPNSMFD